MTRTHDVLIAGAGPVGLFLACELRRAGVSVLVLEQAEDPSAPLKRLPFDLRGLSMPTIEAFHRRGLLDAVARSKDPGRGSVHWANQARQPGGLFAGIQFYRDRIDSSVWPHCRPGLPSPPLAVELEHLESVLTARAGMLGVEIRRGAGVDGLEQSEEGVVVSAGGGRFYGRWLVGYDGGRSMVRRGMAGASESAMSRVMPAVVST